MERATVLEMLSWAEQHATREACRHASMGRAVCTRTILVGGEGSPILAHVHTTPLLSTHRRTRRMPSSALRAIYRACDAPCLKLHHIHADTSIPFARMARPAPH